MNSFPPVCGIVAEYNPFHSGHMFHIRRTRESLGGDAVIVCVMSGNFVQRGDFAVLDKYARAETAVRGGADLVLELPLAAALSSAEGFARGAAPVLTRLLLRTASPRRASGDRSRVAGSAGRRGAECASPCRGQPFRPVLRRIPAAGACGAESRGGGAAHKPKQHPRHRILPGAARFSDAAARSRAALRRS